ncbi:MAG: glutathione peroxidase [Planctomyces sp.]
MNLWNSFLTALAMCFVGTNLMAADPTSVHEFKVKSLEDKEVNLADYKGKVLLVVNVASACGLTPQYEQLQAMHDKYGEKGLVVLGFPCNQFGQQEPGTPAEIRQFCSSEYKVTFPLFAKIDVNGDSQAPLYSFLKSHSKDTGKISWNFEKFVIGKDGAVVARFSPRVKPDAPEVLAAIDAALAK